MKSQFRFQVAFLLIGVAFAFPVSNARSQPANDKLNEQLQKLDPRILTVNNEDAVRASRMLFEDIRQRRFQKNMDETKAWRNLKTVQDWEKFRDERIKALHESLGKFPPAPAKMDIQVTKKIEGDGFVIHNLAYESRPGFWVSANLYLPSPLPKSMPGMLICHSHHQPKHQGELQDMGMTWARQGTAVLVMDQVGHGERRHHPFTSAKSYPENFKYWRQDYYFRYNSGLQLHLVGESLIGWMAWDLMRGVDVMLRQPTIDAKRITLLGAVAGGGDPVGVTGALDKRINAVGPFNFGGPQPENIFPLPKDAENTFNYAGSGSWESTRNLRMSAAKGFAPWVIVGAVAPRALIYGHEFAWDKEHDPVWDRLQKIYQWYKVPDHLSSVKGRGSVKGRPPEATHCTNIGPVHRKQIYPALKKWFDMPVPANEYTNRLSLDELTCFTKDLQQKNQPVHVLARKYASQQIKAYRHQLEQLSHKERLAKIREDWSKLLGGVSTKKTAKQVIRKGVTNLGDIQVERYVLNTERDLMVPMMVLVPNNASGKKTPVVVVIAQQGRAGLLKDRSKTISQLLQSGIAVCLPDLRGTGETQPGSGRRRQSSASSLSASELMLGGTIRGGQCQDLLIVINYLRGREQFDGNRIALWGDSTAKINADDRNIVVPWDASKLPEQAEPAGATVALLTALFDEQIGAVYIRGGLGSYLSVLESPFLYIPHDEVIPSATACGDVCDLAAAISPRPLRIEEMVSGVNKRFSMADKKGPFAVTIDGYHTDKAVEQLSLVDDQGTRPAPAVWLSGKLKSH